MTGALHQFDKSRLTIQIVYGKSGYPACFVSLTRPGLLPMILSEALVSEMKP